MKTTNKKVYVVAWIDEEDEDTFDKLKIDKVFSSSREAIKYVKDNYTLNESDQVETDSEALNFIFEMVIQRKYTPRPTLKEE